RRFWHGADVEHAGRARRDRPFARRAQVRRRLAVCELRRKFPRRSGVRSSARDAERARRGRVRPPRLHPSTKGLALPWPAFRMEFLFDTTRAAVTLVFSGAIEPFPRFRFILPHAGGLAPYFAWRLSVSPMIDPRLPQLARAQVYAGFKHFWYDNALS